MTTATAALDAVLSSCLDCYDRPASDSNGRCAGCAETEALRQSVSDLQARQERLEAELVEARRAAALLRRALDRVEELADEWEDNSYARPASYGQCAEALHLLLEAHS